jgi:hypothetical protein
MEHATFQATEVAGFFPSLRQKIDPYRKENRRFAKLVTDTLTAGKKADGL